MFLRGRLMGSTRAWSSWRHCWANLPFMWSNSLPSCFFFSCQYYRCYCLYGNHTRVLCLCTYKPYKTIHFICLKLLQFNAWLRFFDDRQSLLHFWHNFTVLRLVFTRQKSVCFHVSINTAVFESLMVIPLVVGREYMGLSFKLAASLYELWITLARYRWWWWQLARWEDSHRITYLVLTHLWMLPCYRISNVCLQCLKNYNKNTNEFLMSSCTILYNFFGKSLLHPQPTRVGTHHPPTYENGFFTPELSKTGRITPWSSFEKTY
jgi:hypothetical protein